MLLATKRFWGSRLISLWSHAKINVSFSVSPDLSVHTILACLYTIVSPVVHASMRIALALPGVFRRGRTAFLGLVCAGWLVQTSRSYLLAAWLTINDIMFLMLCLNVVLRLHWALQWAPWRQNVQVYNSWWNRVPNSSAALPSWTIDHWIGRRENRSLHPAVHS